MLFLILLYFFYIVNISFIINSYSCSNIFSTTVKECQNQGRYYNSLICNCSSCNSGLINEDICYTGTDTKSIYDLNNIECTYDGINMRSCNNFICDNGKLTELDYHGNGLGFLMCTSNALNLDNIDFDMSDFDFDTNQLNLKIYFLSNSDDKDPGLGESQSIPTNLIESDIKYYFLSCYNGFYDKSCNILANLCVVAMYNKNNVFCKMINAIKDRVNQINEKQTK